MIKDRNPVKSSMGPFYVPAFEMTSFKKCSQSNTECNLNCSVAWKNLKLNLSVPDKMYYLHFI